MVFENTHPALITREVWDIVQRVRKNKRRLTKMEEQNKYSGLVFCADCGAKLYQARVSELEAAIAEAREQRLNVDSFLGMVLRYTDITELTAEIIRSFVEKIEVKKPEKVPGTRTKADLGQLVELHRRGRYPTTRVKRNGIAYMIVSYAVSFLSILRP